MQGNKFYNLFFSEVRDATIAYNLSQLQIFHQMMFIIVLQRDKR